jgi:hypothetical protein
MKKIALLFTVIASSHLVADVDLVPLDMELGYWETTTQIEANEMMTNMLANLPESQRTAINEMMKSKMKLPVVKQCVTAATFKNMAAQIKDSLSNYDATQNCELQVVSSTSTVFSGVLACEEHSTTVITKVINSKRHETDVSTNMGGLGQNKIKTTGQWISATCPEES